MLIMARTIKIFKSFEEQEMYKQQILLNTTPLERFKALYQMQQLNKKFHPATEKSRKIIIKNGYSES